MKDNALIDKKAYQLAKDYLPAQSIEGVTASLIEKYLNPLTLNPKPTSKEGIYQRILESAQNANMKAGVIGRAIGGVEKLSLVLEGFNPKAVMDKYAGDWEAILNDIVENLNQGVRFAEHRAAFGRTTVRRYFLLRTSLSSFRRRRTSSVGSIFLTETIEHVQASQCF